MRTDQDTRVPAAVGVDDVSDREMDVAENVTISEDTSSEEDSGSVMQSPPQDVLTVLAADTSDTETADIGKLQQTPCTIAAQVADCNRDLP
jgi:hypothetical protein